MRKKKFDLSIEKERLSETKLEEKDENIVMGIYQTNNEMKKK